MDRALRRAARLLVVFLLARTLPASAADSRVLYAPDVVGVDRMFMIAISAPPGAPETVVAVPDCLAMFDHPRATPGSKVRKFYFRALKPAARAEIRFATGPSPIVVPVEIWSFDDLRKFRKLKGVQLPRR